MLTTRCYRCPLNLPLSCLSPSCGIELPPGQSALSDRLGCLSMLQGKSLWNRGSYVPVESRERQQREKWRKQGSSKQGCNGGPGFARWKLAQAGNRDRDIRNIEIHLFLFLLPSLPVGAAPFPPSTPAPLHFPAIMNCSWSNWYIAALEDHALHTFSEWSISSRGSFIIQVALKILKS